MFQNGVECVSGILVVQDVVQNPEQQALKSYYATQSTLPDGSDITAHTAEVLRIVEGASIPKSDWVVGDFWFGSTATAVEVMNKFGVNSSWIIKQIQQWFPMKPLYAVLNASKIGSWALGNLSSYNFRSSSHCNGICMESKGDIICIIYMWFHKTSRKDVHVILLR
jgi:hypothetical protein